MECRHGKDIPRKRKFYCDYGKEKPLKAVTVIDPAKQSSTYRKPRAGKSCTSNKKCGSHEFCHPKEKICHERCYWTDKSGHMAWDNSGKRFVMSVATSQGHQKKDKYKCNYPKGAKPVVLPPTIKAKKVPKIQLHR